MRSLFAFVILGLVCVPCPAIAQRFVPKGFRPFLITLDHNNDFVLTGDGQRITGIDIQSPKGLLELAPGTLGEVEDGNITGSAPAPFQLLVANSSIQVLMGGLNFAPVVNGSYPLGFGPTDLNQLDDIFIQVGFGTKPVENPMNIVCDDCNYPNLQRTPSGGIDLSNVNELIINLTLISADGITVRQLPPGVSVIDSSETQVTLEKLDGFDPASLLELDFASASATSPVFAEFTLASETSFGPFPVAAAAAVPEPSAVHLVSLALVGVSFFRKRCRSHCQ